MPFTQTHKLIVLMKCGCCISQQFIKHKMYFFLLCCSLVKRLEFGPAPPRGISQGCQSPQGGVKILLWEEANARTFPIVLKLQQWDIERRFLTALHLSEAESCSVHIKESCCLELICHICKKTSEAPTAAPTGSDNFRYLNEWCHGSIPFHLRCQFITLSSQDTLHIKKEEEEGLWETGPGANLH